MLAGSPPTVTHVIPAETGVRALASLDDHLYVVRNNRKQVEVYDAVTLTLARRLPVSGISYTVSSIAACSRSKCLYLSDWDNTCIHRVDLKVQSSKERSDGNLGVVCTDAVKTWPVAEKPAGLSVTADHNILVTCLTDKKLQEYTTDGRLVREICVPAGLDPPWHAIQLSTGDYVISQYRSPGAVRVLGVDGHLLRSYPSSSLSDVGPMKYPRSVAVTKHGDILVADINNHRILTINSSLTRAQVFPVDIGLREPSAVYLDDSRDRLYIAERSGKRRVIVMKNTSYISCLLF